MKEKAVQIGMNLPNKTVINNTCNLINVNKYNELIKSLF